MPHLYAIAIGSNRMHGRHGRPAGVVEAAIAELDRRFGLFDASPILLNPAQHGAGRDFANAVALVESDRNPRAMLAELHEIERAFGRRRGKRWSARVLDLDIIAWDGGKLSSRQLDIPHPMLERRAFMLIPLGQIAPAWRVRGSLTARHLAHRLGKARPRG
ncbi:MAG TPA: 2-amino-4-hydroxy-6-hydroxymethyldihydropteridine diphosphokinase [Sphingomicrobium sp.]|nr:2-amino-4-hydroxy-6-hydroxymethyldihydropteridine diphosphokinase [Sphingomicrobium sp.]